MSKLPEKFSEYLIMYKTLTKKISELKKGNSESEIMEKIKKYELERTKIISMFPENFFENYSMEE
jgi:hypothetical protein